MYNQNTSKRLPAPILVALAILALVAAYLWLPRDLFKAILEEIIRLFVGAV